MINQGETQIKLKRIMSTQLDFETDDYMLTTFNGAWAQNIGESETYIDFIGDKAGIRLQYGSDFKIYTAKDHTLYEISPSYQVDNAFQNEIDSFIRCIKSGEKLPSHIDKAIITAKIMQGIYDSSESHREVSFE